MSGPIGMILRKTIRPIKLPRELCFPDRPDDCLDEGSLVWVLEKRSDGMIEAMTLAGPMILQQSDLAPEAALQKK